MKTVEGLDNRLQNVEQLVALMSRNIRTLVSTQVEVERKESRDPLSYRCIPVEPMDIILFGSNGETFRFSGVTDFVESDTSYTFKYFGLSTQTYRFAKFDKPQIVGMSTLTEDLGYCTIRTSESGGEQQ